MEKIFIVGTGTMALGIGQLFLEKGFNIIVYSIFENELKEYEKKLFNTLVKKAKYSEEKASEILKNLKLSNTLEDAVESDLVIEAILEKKEIKKEIFSKLEKIVSENTILATNTSSISITEIASVLTNKERFIGMHFFNPVSHMKLIEVIKGAHTSEETVNKIMELSKVLEKEAVKVNEIPGFIVNRILIPMINEAIMILEQNVATVDEIDKAMKYGANHPIGPLALADLIGNDVVLNIMDTIYEETKDSKYRASYLLRKYVNAGMLGRKTGKGFYNY